MERAGLYSIWFQQVSLVLGLVAFFLPELPLSLPRVLVQGSVWLFLGCLILSRVGLWSFDLAERQIMQDYVPEEKRGIINSVEFSLTNVFSLLSYLLGVVWSRPNEFGVITVISFCAVTLAALLYSLWMKIRPPSAIPNGLDIEGDMPL
jgi:iron-regulated transporter 1